MTRSPLLLATLGTTLISRTLLAQAAPTTAPNAATSAPAASAPTSESAPAAAPAPTPSPAPAPPAAPDATTPPTPVAPSLPSASARAPATTATAAPAVAPDPTRPLVHLGSSHAGAWLELKSSVDQGDWQRVCAAPCDRSLGVDGALARVSAPGMTTSNTFRIQPGSGTAFVRVDGGSAQARSVGILGLFVGVPTAIAGMTLYSYGRFSERDGMQLAGAIVLGTGALTVLASLPLLLIGSTAVRDGNGRVIATHPAPSFGTF